MFLSFFNFLLRWYRIIKTFKVIVYDLKRFTILCGQQLKSPSGVLPAALARNITRERMHLLYKNSAVLCVDSELGLNESVRSSEISRCKAAMSGGVAVDYPQQERTERMFLGKGRRKL